MTKANILALVTKLAVTFKAMFPTKAELTAVDTKADNAQSAADAAQTTANTAVAGNTTAEDNAKAYADTKFTEAKNLMSSLGTFLGAATTYAGLPVQDQLGNDITTGDFAHLTQDDGNYVKGLYRYDGTSYIFISGDATITATFNAMKYEDLDDTVDDKFVTPKWVKDYNDSQQPTQAEVDDAAA